MSLDAWLTIGILTLTFGALLATPPPATVFLGALTPVYQRICGPGRCSDC